MKTIQWLVVAGVMLSTTSCLKTNEDIAPPGNPPAAARPYDWPKIADSTQAALNAFFYNASGKYFTMQPGSSAYNANYWPNAHALDVLIDAYLRKGKDAAVKQQMDNLIEGLRVAQGNTYINYYYDDQAWLLVSALRAFKETNDTRYRNVADILWADQKGGWDTVGGGGFYWRKDRINKNVPANGPTCLFAARAYQLTNNAEYLTWAKNTYQWMKTNFIKSNGDVWDGLYINTRPYAYDNRQFTYNYGTVIGSALELFKITGDQQYKTDAIQVATQCIAALSRNGILVPGDNGDGGLFNGIFVRYLTRLIVEGGLPDDTKSNYIAFLKRNAETMWQRGTAYPAVFIGPDWQTTPSSTTLTPQLSGVMLTEAMAELKRLNLVP